MRVLVACEESQAVTAEFRRLGHEAYSCDLLPCSGGRPDWHILGDALEAAGGRGALQTGEPLKVDGPWDLMVAHPPCTFLSVSGAKWYYHPDDKDLPVDRRRPHPRFPNRREDRDRAVDFFVALADAPVPRIAIENPVGVMSRLWRRPDQVVQPYQFGDEARKTTCLWLKGLPPLVPTDVVGIGEMVTFSSGRRMPKWYYDAPTNARTPEERRTLRSKTFLGMARAMAEQWGSLGPAA